MTISNKVSDGGGQAQGSEWALGYNKAEISRMSILGIFNFCINHGSCGMHLSAVAASTESIGCNGLAAGGIEMADLVRLAYMLAI